MDAFLNNFVKYFLPKLILLKQNQSGILNIGQIQWVNCVIACIWLIDIQDSIYEPTSELLES